MSGLKANSSKVYIYSYQKKKTITIHIFETNTLINQEQNSDNFFLFFQKTN